MEYISFGVDWLNSFFSILFYHKPRGDILFLQQKAYRIYAACGVSQTPTK
jgi:hypothetical protein